jgi:hypothetical protein
MECALETSEYLHDRGPHRKTLKPSLSSKSEFALANDHAGGNLYSNWMLLKPCMACIQQRRGGCGTKVSMKRAEVSTKH